MTDQNSFPVLGYDIGGTKVAVCLADSAGNILAHERLKTGAESRYENILPELLAAAERLLKKQNLTRSDLHACGICAPGPLDIKNGRMLRSPNLKWDNVPIRDDLAGHLDVPTFLDNDANAGVLAEWYFGAAKGCKDVIYLTMSTGIGGGVLMNGHLLQGSTGVGAELGHAVLDLNGPLCGCGMNGCVEAYCGGRNVSLRLQDLLRNRPDHPIMRLPSVKGNLENLQYPALREAVRAEIPLAVKLWDELCLRLAQALGIYQMIFNPEIIVLGTVAYHSGDLLMNPVRDYLQQFSWPEMRTPCKLEITNLGVSIGELSGPAVALYGLT